MISSAAGTRLAKAKAALDAVRDSGQAPCEEMVCAYEDAADALADELIAAGYHDLDGGES